MLAIKLFQEDVVDYAERRFQNSGGRQSFWQAVDDREKVCEYLMPASVDLGRGFYPVQMAIAHLQKIKVL